MEPAKCEIFFGAPSANETKTVSRYGTLSHSWGRVIPYKLETGNIDEGYDKIPMAKISKVFQDIIKTVSRSNLCLSGLIVSVSFLPCKVPLTLCWYYTKLSLGLANRIISDRLYILQQHPQHRHYRLSLWEKRNFQRTRHKSDHINPRCFALGYVYPV